MTTMTYTPVRDLAEEPVLLRFPATAVLPERVSAVRDETGRRYAAQCADDGVLAILSGKRGVPLTLTPVADDAGCGEVTVETTEEHRLQILINGRPFTAYVTDPKLAKPYLGPILTSAGTSYTRLDFATREHPHHRSVFLGIGDVNGVDFWNEPENRGYQIHQGFDSIDTGAAFCRFTASNVWQNSAGQPLVNEKRTVTVYNQSEVCRYVDIAVTYTADYGEVRFGATKEAGPLGIRVCEAMRVDTGDGVMRNSYGAIGEKECWGKPAHWCDYYGSTAPGHMEKRGIAVFDSEDNVQYPTTWHIRDYGLLAPNHFYFRGGVTIEAGKTLTYRYRIVFHEAFLSAETLSDKFIVYITK